MGSEERRGALFNCKEEGRDHSGWKKEAFAANEGSVGCTEEIDQEEVNVFTRRPAGQLNEAANLTARPLVFRHHDRSKRRRYEARRKRTHYA